MSAILNSSEPLTCGAAPPFATVAAVGEIGAKYGASAETRRGLAAPPTMLLLALLLL